jgi:hypothetical protein
VNEILAQAAFAGAFHPHARTIIEMGGEDAKLKQVGITHGRYMHFALQRFRIHRQAQILDDFFHHRALLQ